MSAIVKSPLRLFLLLAVALGLAQCGAPAHAQQQVVVMCRANAASAWTPCSVTTPLPVSASVSASISGFTAATTGTPFTATTGGATGTLPAGAVVVASNAGGTNDAYCQLGASASTASQKLPPNSWFAFTVGASTQITCVTSTSTTTINMTGGAGLPTGAGGGSGGSGGGGGTSSSFAAAFPATGTAFGMTDGTNMIGLKGSATLGAFINLAGVNGAAVAVGHGVAATAIRVELPTDGTGVVGLAAGAQIIGAVTQSGTWNITNVSGTISLPTGAATAAKQPALGTAGSASTDVITIQGIASGTVVPISVASLPLPSGGATSANQTSQITQETAVNTVLGLQADTVCATATGTCTLTALVKYLNNAMASPIPAGTNIIGALVANQSVNLAQVGGTNTVTGGVAGSQSVGGTVATNVAITANPLNLGAQAVSSENAAVTTARQVQLVADLVGKLIVLPYANPENFVSGVITSAMTGTTSTSLVAAPASGLRNYITACTFSNSHATVGTDMILQDGSGGTTIWNVPAAAVYGGAHITFPTPLRQPTTATALFVANVTTGASTKAACSGYKGG